MHFALLDNSCREYLFLADFFMAHNNAAKDLFTSVFGKTLSLFLVSIVGSFSQHENPFIGGYYAFEASSKIANWNDAVYLALTETNGYIPGNLFWRYWDFSVYSYRSPIQNIDA